MIVDPRSPLFWQEEYKRLWDIYGELSLEILMAGALQGVSVLPSGVDLLINWDVFNQTAIDWLRKYGIRHIYQIHQTTQGRALDIISAWIRNGDSLPILERQLARIMSKPRAEMIATTEVTRIYAEGNQQAWKATGVVGAKKWQTAVDERVCGICRPLHNKIVSVDMGWSMDEAGSIIEAGDGLLSPPAHTRCRCWLLPVVSEAMFRDEIRRVLRNA